MRLAIIHELNTRAPRLPLVFTSLWFLMNSYFSISRLSSGLPVAILLFSYFVNVLYKLMKLVTIDQCQFVKNNVKVDLSLITYQRLFSHGLMLFDLWATMEVSLIFSWNKPHYLRNVKLRNSSITLLNCVILSRLSGWVAEWLSLGRAVDDLGGTLSCSFTRHSMILLNILQEGLPHATTCRDKF